MNCICLTIISEISIGYTDNFKRGDEVERFKDEYVKTLEITHELVDQLGLGFI